MLGSSKPPLQPSSLFKQENPSVRSDSAILHSLPLRLSSIPLYLVEKTLGNFTHLNMDQERRAGVKTEGKNCLVSTDQCRLTDLGSARLLPKEAGTLPPDAGVLWTVLYANTVASCFISGIEILCVLVIERWAHHLKPRTRSILLIITLWST